MSSNRAGNFGVAKSVAIVLETAIEILMDLIGFENFSTAAAYRFEREKVIAAEGENKTTNFFQIAREFFIQFQKLCLVGDGCVLTDILYSSESAFGHLWEVVPGRMVAILIGVVFQVDGLPVLCVPVSCALGQDPSNARLFHVNIIVRVEHPSIGAVRPNDILIGLHFCVFIVGNHSRNDAQHHTNLRKVDNLVHVNNTKHALLCGMRLPRASA